MKVTFRSKNELVYESLKQAIINGDYKPGSRLVIDQLAIELGVSQIPIREAVRQLEADGFVTIEPHSGATITEISASLIYEIFGLLESIEVTCGRIAAQSMTEEELNKLEDIINGMDGFIDSPAEWSIENRHLHIFICECAQSTLMKKIMHKTFDHWDRLRRHYLRDVFGKRIDKAQEEHKQLISALRTHDPNKVEQVAREHNRRALESYLEHLRAAGYIVPETGERE
jgi:DNA-binding GntR family transcriptional regulator